MGSRFGECGDGGSDVAVGTLMALVVGGRGW